MKGEDKAIALQSIDTLKTVTCDQDLVVRIHEANLLPEMLQLIQQSLETITNHEYLDFISDFISTFFKQGETLDDQLHFILVAVVKRVEMEI